MSPLASLNPLLTLGFATAAVKGLAKSLQVVVDNFLQGGKALTEDLVIALQYELQATVQALGILSNARGGISSITNYTALDFVAGAGIATLLTLSLIGGPAEA